MEKTHVDDIININVVKLGNDKEIAFSDVLESRHLLLLFVAKIEKFSISYREKKHTLI